MNDVFSETSWLNWLLPLCAVAGALAVFLPVELYSSQWGAVFYAVVAAPLTSIAIVVIAVVALARKKPRQGLAIVCTLLAFLATSWVLLRNQQVLRTEVRWLFASESYKSEMLASSIPMNGVIIHSMVEWERGKFLGQDDSVCFQEAFLQGLTLVTYDRRTIPPLLKGWAEADRCHAGVIFVDEKTISPADIGGLVKSLARLVKETHTWDWTGRIVFLTKTP